MAAFCLRPASQPEGTNRPVIYEVGKLFQLDREHSACWSPACGNRAGTISKSATMAFVFKHLDEIAPEKAIPINRLDPNYHLKSNGAPAVQGRFPVSGGVCSAGSEASRTVARIPPPERDFCSPGL